MSEIARVIDSVVRDALAAPLKADRYRKDGRTWRKTRSDVIRVVQAQGSVWNSGAEGRFTINVGLYFPAVAVLLDGPPPIERPTEPDCLIRQRLGPLLPVGQDYWWRVTMDADLTALAAEVQHGWLTYGRPWLEAHASLPAARDLLARQHRRPFQAAAASLALGDRESAVALWRAAADEAPPTLRWIRSWGERHGLA